MHTQMLSRYRELNTQIFDLEKQINNLPSGELSCASNGKYYKWYLYDNHASTYIPKNNRTLAVQLAYKKYLQALLEDLYCEKQAIQFYLEHHTVSPKTEQILLHPEYQDLLSEKLLPASQDFADWMNAPYERNPYHPEHLVHKSSSGNMVRSKSESIIDMLLYIHQIPFRYECALHMTNTTLYPDFTIRHPKTGSFFYWEHFGLIDNPNYSQNAYSKLQLYTVNGILPGIHLITTYETKEIPLDINTIEKIIKLYFLE